MVVAAGTALLVVAQAFCLGDVVSRVFLGGATLGDVEPVLVVLAVVVVLRAVLGSFSDWLAQQAATRTSAQLRAELLPAAFGTGRGVLCTTEDQLHEALLDAVNGQPELVIIRAQVPKGVPSAALTRLTDALGKKV